MCGLFGWQLPEEVPTDKLKILGCMLAFQSESRGTDSWGVYVPSTGRLVKGLGRASLGVMKWWDSRFVIGHTRHATEGKVSIENAHPLKIYNIVGAHNGVVSNHAELNTKFNRKFEVDSSHLFASVAKHKDETEIKAFGTMTYVDINKRDTVQIVKFNGGVINVIGVGEEYGGGVIWASTKEILEKAVQAAGLEGFAYEVKNGQIYDVRNYTLYQTKHTFNPGDMKYRIGNEYTTGDYTTVDANNWQKKQKIRERARGWKLYGTYTKGLCEYCGRTSQCEEFIDNSDSKGEKILVCVKCEDTFLNEFEEIEKIKQEIGEAVGKNKKSEEGGGKQEEGKATAITTLKCDRCGEFVTKIKVKDNNKYCIPCMLKAQGEKEEIGPEQVEYKCEFCTDRVHAKDELFEIDDGYKVCKSCFDICKAAIGGVVNGKACSALPTTALTKATTIAFEGSESKAV